MNMESASARKGSRGAILLGVALLIAMLLIAVLVTGAIFGRQLDQQRAVETRRRLETAFQAMFPYPKTGPKNMFTDFEYRPDSTQAQVLSGYSTNGWYLDALLDRSRVGASDPTHNPPPAYNQREGSWNGPYWQNSLTVANNRPLDAWGRPIQLRYVTSPVGGWQVFSLGANGLDDTAANSGTPGGDDVVYPMPPYTLPPAAGGYWKKNGTTTGNYDPDNGYTDGFLLTNTSNDQKGSVFWSKPFSPWGVTFDFYIRIGGGGESGADGMALVFADASNPAMSASFLDYGYGGAMYGSYLGTNGLSGAFIGFDTYDNDGPGGSNDPIENYVGLARGQAGDSYPIWEETERQPRRVPNLRTSPSILHVVVSIAPNGKSATVRIGTSNQFNLSFTGNATFPPLAYVGWTGSTGGWMDDHWVGALTITPPPPL